MFKQVVDLYRAVGKPPFKQGQRLNIDVVETLVLTEALAAYQEIEENFSPIDPVVRNGRVEFEFKIPGSERGAFFETFEEFVQDTPTLALGKLRGNFYIRSLDYWDGDVFVPDQIFKLKKVVDFVFCLRAFVSISIDRNQAYEGDKLIFLKPSDGKSPQKAAILKINLNVDTAVSDIPSFKLLAALKSQSDGKTKHQIEERVLLMNTAIAEIIGECDDDNVDFDYLVRNWGRTTKKYLHDLHAYVSSFSFDAARKKISDGLLESTTKLNNAIGEIGTKLLAIPASLGVLIVVKDASTLSGFVMGIAGVVFASLIILRTIRHYENQVENLLNSFEFNLQEAAKPKKTFGKAIRDEIERISRFKDIQRREISRTFRFYKLIATLPIAACIYFCAAAVYPWINLYLDLIFRCGHDALWMKIIENTSFLAHMLVG